MFKLFLSVGIFGINLCTVVIPNFVWRPKVIKFIVR